jgi:hypothetical protein
MRKIICSISIAALLMGTTSMPLHSAGKQGTMRLRNLRSYTVTEQQLDSLKAQKGITFYTELPETLPEGQIAVAVPEELGGGFLVGTPADIAAAFNASGITLGLTAAAVAGTTTIVGGILVVTLAGVLIAALSTTSTHKH